MTVPAGDGLIAEEVDDLREDWMKYADWILDDETIVAAIYQALGKRHPKSRSRGRRGTPAEVVLRLLILKHVRNWSYEVLEREVRANLVYRDFTRVGGGKMPDAKTMGRWGLAVAPEVIKQVHERLVKIANDGLWSVGCGAGVARSPRARRLGAPNWSRASDAAGEPLNAHHRRTRNNPGLGIMLLIPSSELASHLCVNSRRCRPRAPDDRQAARTHAGPDDSRYAHLAADPVKSAADQVSASIAAALNQAA